VPEKTAQLGAIVALAYYASTILLFALRLAGRSDCENWLGLVQTLVALPLVVYLFLQGPRLQRPTLYYVQLGCMPAFLVVELLLDYVLKVDFRQVQWMVIAYVMLFFAGTGGMLGVAAYAGRAWTVAAVLLFLVMAVLAFVQRAITGM